MKLTKDKIEYCLQIIEKKASLNNSSNWVHRDYEKLSDLISDNTGIRLSVSTLKRLWSENYARLPQKSTLDAIAIYSGFKSWYEFEEFYKKSIETGLINIGKEKSRKKTMLIIGFIIAILAIMFLIHHFSNNRSVKEVELIGEIKLPQQVKFDFDNIEPKNNVVINFNNKHIHLDKTTKEYVETYYLPGIYDAEIIEGNRKIREWRYIIPTNEWIALFKSDTKNIPYYVDAGDFMNHKQLFLKEDLLNRKNDSIFNHDLYYYLVKEGINIFSENFSLGFMFKLSLDTSFDSNDLFDFSVLCENGEYDFIFSRNVSEIDNDIYYLSNFEEDIWSSIEIKLSDYELIVNSDQQGENFTKQVESTYGRIIGFKFRTKNYNIRIKDFILSNMGSTSHPTIYKLL